MDAKLFLTNLYTAASRAGHGWTMHPAAQALVEGFATSWHCYSEDDVAWTAFADVAHALEDARAREEYVLYKGYTPRDYTFSDFFDFHGQLGARWESRRGRLAVYVTADGVRVVVRRPSGNAFEVRNIGGTVAAEYSGIAVHYGVLRGLETAVRIATGREVALAGRVSYLGWGAEDEDWPEAVVRPADWAAIKALIEGAS